jgi:hypothetical protein
MIQHQRQKIKPGDVVLYVLRERDMPLEPERKWRGRVLSTYGYYATVQSLEEGYEDEEELIFINQIVEIDESSSNDTKII